MRILTITLLGLFLLVSGAPRMGAGEPAFGPLNLSFEENRGQAPPDAPFVARGHGYNLLLTRDGNQLLLREEGVTVALRMRLAGSNPSPLSRFERFSAHTS